MDNFQERLEEVKAYGTEEDIEYLYYELLQEYRYATKKGVADYNNTSKRRFKAKQSPSIEGRNKKADTIAMTSGIAMDYEYSIEIEKQIEDLLESYGFLDESRFYDFNF